MTTKYSIRSPFSRRAPSGGVTPGALREAAEFSSGVAACRHAFMESPLFVLATALAVLAAPGPTNALLAMSGAMRGVRRSLVLAPAVAAGYLISVTLLRLALGPAIAAAPVAGRILRLLIGAYLFFWRSDSGARDRL